MCHKNLCICINNAIKNDYGAEIHFCNECYEKEDELTNLYNCFKEKYNERLTLVEIQKIIRAKQIN